MRGSYIILLTIILWACSEPTKTKKLVKKIGLENRLFDHQISFHLDSKYERYNVKEIDVLLKTENPNPFIANFFDANAVSFYSSVGKQVYFFIDTSTYKDIIIFQKLSQVQLISADNASLITKAFAEEFQKRIAPPNSTVTCDKSTYGYIKPFDFLHFKLEASNGANTLYSNVIPLATKTSTFLLQNYSTQSTDLLYLKDQISIQ